MIRFEYFFLFLCYDFIEFCFGFDGLWMNYFILFYIVKGGIGFC